MTETPQYLKPDPQLRRPCPTCGGQMFVYARVTTATPNHDYSIVCGTCGLQRHGGNDKFATAQGWDMAVVLDIVAADP